MTENLVMLLGITLECKLNFDQPISNICNAAAAQLNALIRLKSNLPLVARKALIESYIYSYLKGREQAVRIEGKCSTSRLRLRPFIF